MGSNELEASISLIDFNKSIPDYSKPLIPVPLNATYMILPPRDSLENNPFDKALRETTKVLDPFDLAYFQTRSAEHVPAKSKFLNVQPTRNAFSDECPPIAKSESLLSVDHLSNSVFESPYTPGSNISKISPILPEAFVTPPGIPKERLSRSVSAGVVSPDFDEVIANIRNGKKTNSFSELNQGFLISPKNSGGESMFGDTGSDPFNLGLVEEANRRKSFSARKPTRHEMGLFRGLQNKKLNFKERLDQVPFEEDKNDSIYVEAQKLAAQLEMEANLDDSIEKDLLTSDPNWDKMDDFESDFINVPPPQSNIAKVAPNRILRDVTNSTTPSAAALDERKRFNTIEFLESFTSLLKNDNKSNRKEVKAKLMSSLVNILNDDDSTESIDENFLEEVASPPPVQPRARASSCSKNVVRDNGFLSKLSQKLKPRTIVESVKKGPVKAVIPINNMAKVETKKTLTKAKTISNLRPKRDIPSSTPKQDIGSKVKQGPQPSPKHTFLRSRKSTSSINWSPITK